MKLLVYQKVIYTFFINKIIDNIKQKYHLFYNLYIVPSLYLIGGTDKNILSTITYD